MSELTIEKSLQAASTVTRFYEKYVVLRDRLLNNEYEHWAASFPFGNNHGPGHIRRVLDNLDWLLGSKALETNTITAYELFLTMMAILYHDVGILRERKNHGEHSAAFLDLDDNEYIFGDRDKQIIGAAVVSHSSSEDIKKKCAEFSETEYIGGQSARPRVVAALVRLADELDEDHRRADPKVAGYINVPESSRFYWAFCQRILAIRPKPETLDIEVRIEFKPSDIGAVVEVNERKRSFFAAFGEKLAKINSERAYVGPFLPDALKYRRLVVTVRPLPDIPEWTRPREFTFNDATSPVEFTDTFPELSRAPFRDKLRSILEQIRTKKLAEALDGLESLEDILEDVPPAERLRTLWLTAVTLSLMAKMTPTGEKRREEALDSGVEYLERWYTLGIEGAWRQLGETAEHMVYEISSDEDMKTLYENRKNEIETFLGKHRKFLLHTSVGKGGGGGCVPGEVVIEVPGGTIPMVDVRVGTTILSASLAPPYVRFPTTVARVFRSEEGCVLLDGRLICTVSQPLYAGDGKWIEAGDINPGTVLLTADGEPWTIKTVERLSEDQRVYTLTTDHATHNFIAANLVCKNKKLPPPIY